MKRLTALFLCLTMLFCMSCRNANAPAETLETDRGILPESSADVSVTDEQTQAPAPEEGLIYQAHRGLSTDFPENTVLAIEEAIKAGFKICEIDPNFTKDGRCVLMHDSTVNRTCRRENGIPAVGDVSSYTFEDLRRLDAGLFKGEQFKGVRVPLLSEAVQAANKGGITVKIDNKIQNFSAAEQEIVFMLAEQYPETVGITCKTVDFVQKVAKRLPEAIIHYDGEVNENICKQIREIAGDRTLYIWYSVEKANEDVCKMIKKYGILGLWTVKTVSELNKAERLGADIIETNGEVKPE